MIKFRSLIKEPYFILMIWSFWLASTYIVFGRWSFLRIPDEGEQAIPISLSSFGRLVPFGSNLWAAELAGGVDALANSVQSGLEGLLYQIIPNWAAYGTQVWLLYLFGGIFTYKILAEFYGADRTLSLFGGLFVVTFTMEGFLLITLGAAIVFIWALPKIFNYKLLVALLISFLFGLVFSLFGQPTITFLFSGMVLVWAASNWAWRKKQVACVLIFTFGTLIGEAQSSWAMLSQLSISTRETDALVTDQYNLHSVLYSFRRWGLFFLLPIAASFVSKMSRRDVGMIATLTGLILAQPFYIVLIRVGLLPEAFAGWTPNLIFAMPFAVIFAQVVALDTLIKHQSFTLKGIWRQGAVITAVGTIIFVSVQDKKRQVWDMLHGSTWATVFEHPDLEELRVATAGDEPFRVVSPWMFRSMFRQEPMAALVYGFEMADGFTHLTPNSYNEYWKFVNAGVTKIDKISGGGGEENERRLYLRSTNGLTWEMCAPQKISDCELDFSKFWDLNLLALGNVKYIFSYFPLSAKGLNLLPSKTRVSLLSLSQQPVRNRWLAALNGRYGVGNPLYIYENQNYLPRFYIAHKAEVVNSNEEIFRQIKNSSIEIVRNKVFLRSGDVQPRNVPDSNTGTSKIEIKHYSSDRIDLNVFTTSKSMLVNLASFNAFWRVCVNGIPGEVVPANGAFQAIPLAAGSHEVVLRYLPPYRIPRLTACSLVNYSSVQTS